MTGHPADFFSEQSEVYAKVRPRYPEELFMHIATHCPDRQLAWDAGTGNGQAAASLGNYYREVYATDISEAQLRHAIRHPRVSYQVEASEKCALKTESCDLVTVATALHWFNLDSFYQTVDRVLKPNGVLAVWSYAGCKIRPELDRILDNFAFKTLSEYWPRQATMNWKERYANLPFPYPFIKSPDFSARGVFNFDQMLSYLNSWSSVQQFIEKEGKNPVEFVKQELLTAWGNPDEKKVVTWELFFRMGKKPEREN